MNSTPAQTSSVSKAWVSDEAKLWMSLLTGGVLSAGGLGWVLYSGMVTKDKWAVTAVLTGSAGLSIVNTAVTNLVLTPQRPNYAKKTMEQPQKDSSKSASTTATDLSAEVERLWLAQSKEFKNIAATFENNCPNLEDAALEVKLIRMLADYTMAKYNGLKSNTIFQRPTFLHQDFKPNNGLKKQEKLDKKDGKTQTTTVTSESSSQSDEITAETNTESKPTMSIYDELLQATYVTAYRLERKLDEIEDLLLDDYESDYNDDQDYNSLIKKTRCIDSIASKFLGDCYTGKPKEYLNALEAEGMANEMSKDNKLAMIIEYMIEFYWSSEHGAENLPAKEIYDRAVKEYLMRWKPITEESQLVREGAVECIVSNLWKKCKSDTQVDVEKEEARADVEEKHASNNIIM